MTSFLVTCFVELRIEYQSVKFPCCRISAKSFIDELRKHNDDVMMTSFHVVDLKILNVVKLNIGYEHFKFQISWLS